MLNNSSIKNRSYVDSVFNRIAKHVGATLYCGNRMKYFAFFVGAMAGLTGGLLAGIAKNGFSNTGETIYIHADLVGILTV